MGTYRELDEQAVYLSRIVDYGDWFFKPAVFAASPSIYIQLIDLPTVITDKH